MKNSTINWILCDIDGTLLYYDMKEKKQIIENETINEIQKFVLKKNEFSLISGRNYQDMLGVLKKIGIEDEVKYIVACNGSIIYNVQQKQIIYKNLLSQKNIEQIFAIKKKLDKTKKRYVLSFYLLDGSIYLYDSAQMGYELKKSFMEFESSFYKHNYEIEKDLPSDAEVVKAIFYFFNPWDKIENLQKEFLKKIENSKIYFTNSQVLEVNPFNSSKGDAAKFIEKIDSALSLDNAMTIGDSGNDVSMFKISKHAVTLLKARDSVKKYASIIIDKPPSMFVGEAIKMIKNNFI